MFVYDENGELSTTTDKSKPRQMLMYTNLRASSYPIKPEVVGRLRKILGEVDPDMSKRRAERELQRALAVVGYQNVPISVAVEGLDKTWAAKLDVGE